MISAAQLYDFVHCPHRVSMDAFGDPDERDETSPFVELLWEQGLVHEATIARDSISLRISSCLAWLIEKGKLCRQWRVMSHSSMVDA
jgi:hypothetical protein